MLSESEIDKLTREVVAGAEEEFIAQLTAALVDDYVHGIENGASSQWRMEELARANREHVDTILRQFQNTAISEAANLVLAALIDADERSARMIANHQGKEVRAATRQSQLMAKQTARGVGEIVRRQNIDLAAQAERRWYEVTAQTLALSNRGALPRGYYERAIIELGRAGVSKVNYRSGVSNQIDVAIKRHIRTQVNQAAGHMEIERLNDTGHNLVITSAHFGARPEHAVWQGKAFSMSGRQVVNGVVYEDFYQQTGYGTVTGLCGANCRHHFGVYIPGMALPELPETINGMDSDEYYAATQRQRELERRVRKTKRDISALEQAGVGLDSPTYVQKRLVLGNQQKQLRQLCADKGLKREPYREKAYGIGKQPVALRSKGKPKASVAAVNEREQGIKLKRYKDKDVDTTINRSYIDSSEYSQKFVGITGDRKTDMQIRDCAKAALTHRSGTYCEDLHFVSVIDGEPKLSVTDRTEYLEIPNTPEIRKVVAEEPEGSLFAIHNHPHSTPPSGSDFYASYMRGYNGAIVACHNGDVYYYKHGFMNIEPVSFDNKVEKTMRKYKLTDWEATERVMNEYAESHGIVWRKIK